MDKMVMIAYNEAIDLEVMEVLTRCGAGNYTKVTGVFGKGETSGIHLGNDIWPGRNNILYVGCEEKQAEEILSSIRELRKRLGREGVKAFVLSIEKST